MTLEHYPGMAEAEIARHVEEAQARWPLLGVTVIHRYGRMVPGDNIVLVVTASSHREAAFAAAEFLMDYLKTRAPFWKQEERAGGGDWVEAAQATTPPRRAGAAADLRPPNDKTTGEKPALKLGEGVMIRWIAAVLAALASCGGICRYGALFSRDLGRASARRRGRARRHGLVHGAAPGRARHPRSEDRQGRADPARQGRGAARRDRGPDGAAWITESGLNAIARVDPKSRDGEAVPAAEGLREGQPQHRDLRQGRHALVHRPERRLRPASIRRAARSKPGRRRRARAPTASPPRRRASLVRLARRRPHRARRYRDRRRDHRRSAEARRRSAPHLVGLERHAVGELLALRRGRPLRSGAEDSGTCSRCRRARAAAIRSTSTRRTRSG